MCLDVVEVRGMKENFFFLGIDFMDREKRARIQIGANKISFTMTYSILYEFISFYQNLYEII